MPFDTPASPSDQPITAAMALARVAADPDLAPARKRDLFSALNHAVRFSGLPAPNLVLSAPELRERLLRHSSGGLGLSLSRWRSIKSALNAVLRMYGAIEPKSAPIDPGWTALLERLEGKRRCYLLELARYASATGVMPSGVDQAVFERFLVHLTDRTLTPHPRKLTGAARALWNRCHAKLPDWPGHRVAPLEDPNNYVIPLQDFPASFSDAVAAYCVRLGTELPDDFGDEEEDEPTAGADVAAWIPLAKSLQPSTIATRRDHLRWAASALVASGVPIEQVTSLPSLVSPHGHVRAIMRFLMTRAEGKPSSTAMHVLEVLRIIAKYEARLPQARLDKISEWRAKAVVRYEGITRKNRQIVRTVLDPAREKALLQLPAAMMTAARKLRDTDPPAAARLALRATAIRILLSIPMRLKNLIGLRFDQHLKRPDLRRRLISHIEIPFDEAKNQEPLIMHVSPALSTFINEWIDDFRPALAADTCLYVFPGQGTGSQSVTPQGLREGIKTATARHVGVAINPHAFRHIAAMRYLEAYPDGMEEVSRLLGHTDPATAKRHYAIINNKHLFERFDALGSPRRVAKAPAPASKSRRPPAAKAPTPGKSQRPPSPSGRPTKGGPR